MGGGLMQLVAYGAQDVYLSGNPQITFWFYDDKKKRVEKHRSNQIEIRLGKYIRGLV